MKDFGTVKSAVRPEPMVVDEFSVWISTDIQDSKDEYIRLMAERNATLEGQMTDLQMALCDVYEMME